MKLSNKVINPKGIKYELDKEVFTGDYWIDGSPIYAYAKQILNPKDNSVIKSLNDDENLIGFFGQAYFGDSLVTCPFASTNDNVYTQQYSSPREVRLKRSGSTIFSKVNAVVFFTKSGGVINNLLSKFKKWGVCHAN